MEVKTKNINSVDVYNLSRELRSYLKNNFILKKNLKIAPEEKSSLFWKSHFESKLEATMDFNFVKQCYPQLNFPIEKEINQTTAYKDATLKGILKGIEWDNNKLALNDIANISLELYHSFAGNTPILIIPHERDFEKIIQSLLHKNNPSKIPASMGASIINGINNWQKIKSLQNNFLSQNRGTSWAEEFKKNILPFPHLYKDRLIIISKKYYSNVPPKEFGLTGDYWSTTSMKIRLNHECTHLYTLKKYGIASNNLHDELIADYIGIVKALGSYRKQWMLQFMGLEDYPSYRKGGRLENYIQDIEINSSDFALLTSVIKNSIENISLFDSKIGSLSSNKEIKHRIQTLCEVDLLDIASKNGSEYLLHKYYS